MYVRPADHKPHLEELEIFERAPEHKKEKLSKAPLFPDDMTFASPASLDSTRPLNYIMFAYRIDALKEISPYLTRDDWIRLGPYESTFMHCIIAGMEKAIKYTYKNKPVECTKYLLEQYPDFATKTNEFNATPLEYLKFVLGKLKRNLQHTRTYGGGGFGGLNKTVTTKTCLGERYNESESDYESLIKDANMIIEILKKY